MTATTIEVLKNARDRIADPSRWTRECSARDILDNPCSSLQTEAVKWCSMGAVKRAALELKAHVSHMWDALDRLDARMKGDIPLFNDTHSHSEVLMAFQGAIRDAEIN